MPICWTPYSTKHFSRLQHGFDEPALNLAQLLARLCVNSRSGLAGDRKNDAIGRCCQTHASAVV